MRICILTTRHSAIDDRIYYKEALSLRKRFTDLTIVAPSGTGEGALLEHRIAFRGLRTRAGLLGRFAMLYDAVKEVFRLRPDVCHFHDLDQVIIVPLLRRRGRCRLIYDCHEAYPESVLTKVGRISWSRKALAWAVDRVEKFLSRHCEIVITADDATRDTFRRKGIQAESVCNFPPLQLFARGVTTPAQILDERLVGRRVILYQGTMSEDRGLFHMIRALDLIRKELPATTLWLLGLPLGSALYEQVEKAVRERQLRDQVVTSGWMPHANVPSLISTADVGLVPWLPFQKHCMNVPIKLFEYWACRVPVVASDLPSFGPFVKESGGGVLYQPGDDVALARAVLGLLKDEERRQAMAQKGKKYVDERANWDHSEAVLLKCYEEIEQKRAVI